MSEKKIRWNSEKVLSVSAMAISFITLIIFIYQTNLMSRQNYLSIMPYLATSTSNNPKLHAYSISLQNHGIGPAIIESVTFRYKNREYDLKDFENEVHTFLKTQDARFDSLQTVSYGTLDKGLAIPANTNYLILGVEGYERDYKMLMTELNRLLDDGLEYEIVYKSIQDEHWVIHNDSEGPEKL
ncbi:MAG: hypothetical protein R2824_20525 [Saprospiraceae bacterium]|nr:hypothetical protein [Lewinella sp.]